MPLDEMVNPETAPFIPIPISRRRTAARQSVYSDLGQHDENHNVSKSSRPDVIYNPNWSGSGCYGRIYSFSSGGWNVMVGGGGTKATRGAAPFDGSTSSADCAKAAVAHFSLVYDRDRYHTGFYGMAIEHAFRHRPNFTASNDTGKVQVGVNSTPWQLLTSRLQNRGCAAGTLDSVPPLHTRFPQALGHQQTFTSINCRTLAVLPRTTRRHLTVPAAEWNGWWVRGRIGEECLVNDLRTARRESTTRHLAGRHRTRCSPRTHRCATCRPFTTYRFGLSAASGAVKA